MDETRSSALWGTGNRGGESRSNALWGKGGRGALTALAAMLAISVPLAASAAKYSRRERAICRQEDLRLARSLEQQRQTSIRSRRSRSSSRPTRAFVLGKNQVNQSRARSRRPEEGSRPRRRRRGRRCRRSRSQDLGHIDGLTDHAGRAGARQRLQLEPALAVRDRASRRRGADRRTELGLRADDRGRRLGHPGRPAPTSATASLASVNLGTLPDNSPGDGRGHGTFVAGIAAGAADGYAGATPQANLVSLDVMDDHGVARTSDVIAACQWILANKAKYNIRVANFSLHSATKSNFTQDPLDKAVEKLWFNGVVVVAAAGNYGTRDGPSGVLYAPGNDPFVITVGAIDIGGTKSSKRRLRRPVVGLRAQRSTASRSPRSPPPAATWSARCRRARRSPSSGADNVVAPGYMQLSGTSFAAPVVAGAAAQILAKPSGASRPDQVKGALMVSAKSVGDAAARLGRRRRAPDGQGGADAAIRRTRTRRSTSSSSATRPAATTPSSTASAGTTRRRRTSPGTRFRGTRSPGPTSARVSSPGRTSPGRTSPGPMCPGPTSPGPTSPGTTLLRGRGRGRHRWRSRRVRADPGAGGRDHGRPGDRAPGEHVAGSCRQRPRRHNDTYTDGRDGSASLEHRAEPIRSTEEGPGADPGPSLFRGIFEAYR